MVGFKVESLLEALQRQVQHCRALEAWLLVDLNTLHQIKHWMELLRNGFLMRR